ncbi:MAG: class I tRNA ligase family protein, partial [Anaerolineae bacterium]|nr:class I tRNA ligase family protein [Anaerolineae bacterium]
EGAKMSKSRGNVINPDDYIARYGADTLRLYMLFLGPFERGGDFSDAGIQGMVRFLRRVWRLATEVPAPDDATATQEPSELLRLMHQTIAQVTDDIEALKFNTAIAALMTCANGLEAWQGRVRSEVWREALHVFLRLLAPLAPHITEELWMRQGQPFSVHRQPWPTWSEEVAAEKRTTLVVQVDGKLRERLDVPAEMDEARARKLALNSEAVQRALDGRPVERVIYVPGRVLNLVTG